MEYHVLIAWNRANIKERSIEEFLYESRLRIVKRFHYTWDKNIAKENYAAFYGEKLENIQYKVDHCGKGSFKVYIIVDEVPYYDKRVTSKGERIVNCNLFDLKVKLRKYTGGGHLIHASDTVNEANLNCMSLFGMLAEELVEYFSNYSDHQVICIKRNVTGVNGWDSWGQLLETINKLTPYIVLRNPETITLNNHDNHGDTDLLVYDFDTAITVAVARKEAIGKNRVLYSVLINGEWQLVDFRYCGDGYYCNSWEEKMLLNRKKYKNTSLWISDNKSYTFALLYHALVHKPYISDDYKAFLKEKFGTVNRIVLILVLKKYIRSNNYSFSKPIDNSVYIHPDFFSCISIPIRYRIINQLKVIKYNRGGYERKKIRNPKIFKILYSGYYMGINVLRRIKKRITKILHN